jgi:hypothetical protein
MLFKKSENLGEYIYGCLSLQQHHKIEEEEEVTVIF